MSDPNCFMAAWKEANYLFSGTRHYPRFLFLPLLPETTNYGESLFAANETDLSPDILVAEFEPFEYSAVQGESCTWSVNMFTNNFYERPGAPGRIGAIFLDKWQPGLGFDQMRNLYPDKLVDMRGKEMGTYVVEYVPYCTASPFDGVEVRLLKIFCELSNCRLTGGITDSDDWGDIFPENRTGIGCAGMVYLRIVEFCLGANYPSSNFWPHIDFSTSYMQGEWTVIVPKPTLRGSWSTPFLPFPLTIWLSIMLCILVSTFGLHIATSITYKYAPRLRGALDTNRKFFSIADSFFRSIGMIVLQQPQKLVTGSPVRHIFTSLEIVYLILTTCYAAALIDYLTVPRTNKPIENAHDLADSNIIWYANDPAWNYFTKDSDDPKLRKMADNFRVAADDTIRSILDSSKTGAAVSRLIGGTFVELSYFSDKFLDASITMKESYIKTLLYVYMQKGSPYKKRLDEITNRVSQAGLWFKWESDCAAKLLDYGKQQKLQDSTKKVNYPPKMLKLADVVGAFIVYFIGSGVSILFFVFEIYASKKFFHRV